jgi:hypothetical protein
MINTHRLGCMCARPSEDREAAGSYFQRSLKAYGTSASEAFDGI